MSKRVEIKDGHELFGFAELQIFAELAELKAEEAELTERIDARRARIRELMSEAREEGKLTGATVIFNGFEYTEKTRRTYAYNESIVQLEEELKALKARSVENGEAVEIKATPYLEFRETRLVFDQARNLWTNDVKFLTETVG